MYRRNLTRLNRPNVKNFRAAICYAQVQILRDIRNLLTQNQNELYDFNNEG